MIEILGVNEGKEFEAASHLRKQILAVWPDLVQSADDHVRIFVLYCSGARYEGITISGVELVLDAKCAWPRKVTYYDNV